jgi:hypothetical protein
MMMSVAYAYVILTPYVIWVGRGYRIRPAASAGSGRSTAGGAEDRARRRTAFNQNRPG